MDPPTHGDVPVPLDAERVLAVEHLPDRHRGDVPETTVEEHLRLLRFTVNAEHAGPDPAAMPPVKQIDEHAGNHRKHEER